jgi:hypothetical protein
MNLASRLACLVRGGHRWETTTDSAGSVTACARCGTVARGGASPIKSAGERASNDAGRYGDAGRGGD